MATVHLMCVEAEQGLLPPVCMQCGEPATENEAKSFSWHPSWAWLLFGILGALLTQKKCVVRAPFCQDHRDHWRWRNKVTGGLIIAPLLVSLGVIALFAFIDNNDLTKTLGPVAAIGCVALAIAGLIGSIIVQSKAIAATEITAESIFLKNVCPEFVEALHGTRAENPERVLAHIQASARASRSGGWIVAAVLLGGFLFIIALVAIGNIDREAKQQQKLVVEQLKGIAEVVNEELEFRLRRPGEAWFLVTDENAQQIDPGAVAAARYGDRITGVIIVETVEEGVKIEGQEEKIARDVIGESDLMKVRIVRDVMPLTFKGKKAARYQIVGVDDVGEEFREQCTVLIHGQKVYRILMLGPVGSTAEDGSTFRPFEDAFEPLWKDTPPKRKMRGGAATAPDK